MNTSQTISITLAFPAWFYGVLTLSLAAFLLYIGGLHWKIKEMCKDYPRIREALTRISEILLQKHLAKDYVFSQSPISLTPAGIAAVKEAGFEEFYNINKKILFERINKANPKTMADLEEVCKSIMLELEDTLSGFESIKQYAYQHGEPISKILFACAVDLRDRAAKELKLS